jgi:hypothetical protein
MHMCALGAGVVSATTAFAGAGHRIGGLRREDPIGAQR